VVLLGETIWLPVEAFAQETPVTLSTVCVHRLRAVFPERVPGHQQANASWELGFHPISTVSQGAYYYNYKTEKSSNAFAVIEGAVETWPDAPLNRPENGPRMAL